MGSEGREACQNADRWPSASHCVCRLRFYRPQRGATGLMMSRADQLITQKPVSHLLFSVVQDLLFSIERCLLTLLQLCAHKSLISGVRESCLRPPPSGLKRAETCSPPRRALPRQAGRRATCTPTSACESGDRNTKLKTYLYKVIVKITFQYV